MQPFTPHSHAPSECRAQVSFPPSLFLFLNAHMHPWPCKSKLEEKKERKREGGTTWPLLDLAPNPAPGIRPHFPLTLLFGWQQEMKTWTWQEWGAQREREKEKKGISTSLLHLFPPSKKRNFFSCLSSFLFSLVHYSLPFYQVLLPRRSNILFHSYFFFEKK